MRARLYSGAFLVAAFSFLPPWIPLRPSRYPGYDVLYGAINRNEATAVRNALESGINPDTFPNDFASAQSEEDIAPLNAAVSLGNIEIVTLLLKHHADPNIRDGWDSCPLAAAVAHENIAMMKLLIAYGAKVNNGYFGSKTSSALYRAALDGKVKATAFLLANGANPNTSIWEAKNKRKTLLHIVKSFPNNPQIISLLKKYGATE